MNNLLIWILESKYKDRNIYIFAGLEPIVRYRQKDKVWEFKTSDCVRCGKCCSAIRSDHPLGKESGEIGCRYLDDQGTEMLCGLGIFRPYGCAIAEMETIKDCKVKWGDADK